jgi:hypothetical protein
MPSLAGCWKEAPVMLGVAKHPLFLFEMENKQKADPSPCSG